ncbi:restriction endonuclease subunit S [Algiphilus aromaticivorans]|uniref:restriction endonuclease subunit S n=1 Tax=Algiphilus aromaticivorans TaxID=382454 RepID=UPI0018DCBB30|nr:restriction endonuclease subunit S [Algiphilus aromaticivorans]
MRCSRPLSEVARIQQGRYLAQNEMAECPGPGAEVPVWGANGILGYTSEPEYQQAVALVTCRGNGCGKVQWTRAAAHVSNNAMAIIPMDGDGVDQRFMYYSLHEANIASVISGSAQPQITRTHLSAVAISWPDRGERERIVECLDSLDQRIANNRFLATNLESIARAIFKSWFVDFDPVRAKMEGREPEGMDPEIAALFPDRLVESELGFVPEGWEWVPLSEMAEFLNGLALQKFPPNGHDDLPVLKIAQLRSGALDPDKLASREVGDRYIVSSGDLIFSWSGSLMVDVWCSSDCALNQHLFKVNPASWASKGLLWAAIQKNIEGFQAIAASKAVTMGHINRRHLDEAFVALPSRESVKIMSSSLDALTENIIHARLESHALASLRDFLLPRLISGRLSIKEVEAAANTEPCEHRVD